MKDFVAILRPLHRGETVVRHIRLWSAKLRKLFTQSLEKLSAAEHFRLDHLLDASDEA